MPNAFFYEKWQRCVTIKISKYPVGSRVPWHVRSANGGRPFEKTATAGPVIAFIAQGIAAWSWVAKRGTA